MEEGSWSGNPIGKVGHRLFRQKKGRFGGEEFGIPQ